MGYLRKGDMIKYVCDTEGYTIYFENLTEAAKYFFRTGTIDHKICNTITDYEQRVSLIRNSLQGSLHYKKGVIYFESTNVKNQFIDDTIYRVFVKPDKIKFNDRIYKYDKHISIDEFLIKKLEGE